MTSFPKISFKLKVIRRKIDIEAKARSFKVQYVRNLMPSLSYMHRLPCTVYHALRCMHRLTCTADVKYLASMHCLASTKQEELPIITSRHQCPACYAWYTLPSTKLPSMQCIEQSSLHAMSSIIEMPSMGSIAWLAQHGLFTMHYLSFTALHGTPCVHCLERSSQHAARSPKAKRREPKNSLCHVFNFKLGCISYGFNCKVQSNMPTFKVEN